MTLITFSRILWKFLSLALFLLELLETIQVDTYCPVDIVQLGKLDQILSKAQMVHIMLYFPTIKGSNGSHNVVLSNMSKTF